MSQQHNVQAQFGGESPRSVYEADDQAMQVAPMQHSKHPGTASKSQQQQQIDFVQYLDASLAASETRMKHFYNAKFAEQSNRMDELVASLRDVQSRVTVLEDTVQNLNIEEIQEQAMLAQTMAAELMDERVYLLRDTRQILLESDRLMQAFDAHGATRVLEVIGDWAASFQASKNGQEIDHYDAIVKSKLFKSGERLGNRLVLQLGDKGVRDDVARYLQQSEERKTFDPQSRIRAKLTLAQLRNKNFIFDAFTANLDAVKLGTAREWLPGYKLVLMADDVLIYATGHKAFKINLGYAPSTTQELVKQAKLLKPNDSSSTIAFANYRAEKKKSQQYATMAFSGRPAQQPAARPTFPRPPALRKRVNTFTPPPKKVFVTNQQHDIAVQRAMPPAPALHPSRVPVADLEQQEAVALSSGIRSRLRSGTSRQWLRTSQPSDHLDTALPATRVAALVARTLTVASWNCAGIGQQKLTELQAAMDAISFHAHVIALQEILVAPSPDLVAGFWSSAELHTLGGSVPRGRGVALFLRSDVTCLGSESSPEFVAAAVSGNFGVCVVCSVYVPPVQRGYTAVQYSATWDRLLEAARTLQLQFSVAPSAICLVGDFNAHISTQQAGIPAVYELQSRRTTQTEYRLQATRQSCCLAPMDPRGQCVLDNVSRNNLMVLNGRSERDLQGRATMIWQHADRSVLDLAVVSTHADADLQVLDVHDGGHVHRAIVVWINLSINQIRQLAVSCGAVGCRPAPWKLTRAQQLSLCQASWQPLLADFRDMQMRATSPDILLQRFENYLDLQISSVTGVDLAACRTVRRQRSHPANPNKSQLRRQPWFDGQCASARQKCFTLRTNGAERSLIADATRLYRQLCRRRKSEWLWQLERMRCSNPRQFWSFLRKPLVEPEPSLKQFLNHFEKLFGSSPSSSLPLDLATRIASAQHDAITADEVFFAASNMRRGKTTALANFSIELLGNTKSSFVWEILAQFFNRCVDVQFPAKLNTMLFMPLFKKGDQSDCDNYRGISLIHPLGRLFAKVITYRLENDPKASRATCQAGFRAQYRLEDNCLLLLTAFERAAQRKERWYCCFVDLQKAYDSIPRTKLFEVLVDELGVDLGTVKCLQRMYADVCAAVCIAGQYTRQFQVYEGVRQGCPASPLLFSLFMDRLEGFINEKVLFQLSGTARESIRVAGVLVPMLLFADDIVFMSSQLEVLQQLLNILAAFCDDNGLTVSIKKTKWLVGGRVGCTEASCLHFKGAALEQVQQFKYLGLEFTGSTNLRSMQDARLIAAKKSWGVLQTQITTLGWQDRATRLVLFEAYVRSVLLFGCVVWGVNKLATHAPVSVDLTGAFGTFYRSCLRSLMGIGRDVRNEIVYVLSARPPLALYITKAIVQYVSTLSTKQRLVGTVLTKIEQLDNLKDASKFSCVQMRDLVTQSASSVRVLYRAVTSSLRTQLCNSDRLRNRWQARVWADLVVLAFGESKPQVQFPAAFYLPWLHANLPSFRVRVVRHKVYACSAPTWLQLKPPLFHQLLCWLYLEADTVQFVGGESVLDIMADLEYSSWSPREQAMALMVRNNGLGFCLWCDAAVVLGMLA